VQIHNWMGESRGHWENGNTLVVETTNLRPGPSATNIGTTGSPGENDTPVSEQAEADRALHDDRAGFDHLRVHLDRPGGVRAAVVGAARVAARRRFGIYEYACHEGDVQIRNFITASRAERAAGAQDPGWRRPVISRRLRRD
jgi:hypothetical protein